MAGGRLPDDLARAGACDPGKILSADPVLQRLIREAHAAVDELALAVPNARTAFQERALRASMAVLRIAHRLQNPPGEK